MTRITSTDTMSSTAVKMADGDPGALDALVEVAKYAETIDPQSGMGPLAPMLGMNTQGIYGTEIYILWSDKCQRNIRKFLMLLRAVQLGFLPPARLKEMAEDQTRSVDLMPSEWEKIDSQVCEELSEFMSSDKWDELVAEAAKIDEQIESSRV